MTPRCNSHKLHRLYVWALRGAKRFLHVVIQIREDLEDLLEVDLVDLVDYSSYFYSKILLVLAELHLLGPAHSKPKTRF